MSLKINEGLGGFWVSRGPAIPQCAVSQKFHQTRADAEGELEQVRREDEFASIEWMKAYDLALRKASQASK